jgi:hypothetical protein
MKLLLSAFLIAFIIGGFGLAGTLQIDTVQAFADVAGIISSDTAWTKANSPCKLTGPVAVDTGATLTIEAGVTVNLNGYYIQVNGTLIARGNSTNPINFDGGSITFTSISNSWNEQTGSGCIIENANFSTTIGAAGITEYPNKINIDNSSPKISGNSNASITINGGSPIISENTLRNVQITSGTPKILNNIITSSVSIDEGSPLLFSNTIHGGIDTYDYPVDGSPVIWNNTITYPGGVKYAVIDLQFNGMPIVFNNNITGLSTSGGVDSYGRQCKTEYTGYGIRITGNAYISNNVISGCINASILVYGFPNAKVTIQNNTLYSKGIIIKGAVSTQINYNNIEGSISLAQDATTDVDATYNWWGTTDTSEISQTIHDFEDEFTLGKVDFIPFLTTPNTVAMPDPNASPPVAPDDTSSTSPTHIHELLPTEITIIIGAAITTIVLGAGISLLIYLIKRK